MIYFYIFYWHTLYSKGIWIICKLLLHLIWVILLHWLQLMYPVLMPSKEICSQIVQDHAVCASSCFSKSTSFSSWLKHLSASENWLIGIVSKYSQQSSAMLPLRQSSTNSCKRGFEFVSISVVCFFPHFLDIFGKLWTGLCFLWVLFVGKLSPAGNCVASNGCTCIYNPSFPSSLALDTRKSLISLRVLIFLIAICHCT